jgi:hypothetical protein
MKWSVLNLMIDGAIISINDLIFSSSLIGDFFLTIVSSYLSFFFCIKKAPHISARLHQDIINVRYIIFF